MLKAFSYLLAFVVIAVIGIFGWLSFTEVPIEQQRIEQPIQIPAQS